MKKAESTARNSENLVFALKEQIHVLNHRYTREINRLTEENTTLKAQLALTEIQLVSEQQKKDEIYLLAKDMAQLLAELEEQKYNEQVQESVLDTIARQGELINDQQDSYDNEEITPVNVEDLLSDINSLSYDSDEENEEKNLKLQSMLTVQHFGYLHEVINAQKEQIKQLEKEFGQDNPTISNHHKENLKSDEPKTIFDKQKKVQINEEKSNLTEYILQLQEQITQEKETLNRIKQARK